MNEVLADAGADLEQVGDGGVDVGRALAVLEPVGDQLGDEQQRAERGRCRARRCEQLLKRRMGGRVIGLEQELASGLAVAGVAQGLPGRLGRLRGRLGGDARPDVDRQ